MLGTALTTPGAPHIHQVPTSLQRAALVLLAYVDQFRKREFRRGLTQERREDDLGAILGCVKDAEGQHHDNQCEDSQGQQRAFHGATGGFSPANAAAAALVAAGANL